MIVGKVETQTKMVLVSFYIVSVKFASIAFYDYLSGKIAVFVNGVWFVCLKRAIKL